MSITAILVRHQDGHDPLWRVLFCGFGGPGTVKVADFYADRYLIVADMSALPFAAATLEAMPRNAVGDAFFDVMHADVVL